MATKNVYVFKVELSSIRSFSDILLDCDYHSAIPINTYKTAELKHIHEKPNGTITGMFVTTQRKGIPPTHKPGEDDYSAVPLADGEGLAYPNTILFSPATKALYIESNKLGLSDISICDYFEKHAIKQDIPDFGIELLPVLKAESYERVDRMTAISSIECKIANPIELLREEQKAGALEQFGKLSQEMNASKTMYIQLKSEELSGGLVKKEVLNVIDFFSRLVNKSSFKPKQNKLKITGLIHSDGSDYIEDSVDFLLDRMKGQFSLDEPNVASHLQYSDREKGVINVYMERNAEVTNILGRG